MDAQERMALLTTEGQTIETVKQLTPSLTSLLGKPQRLLQDDPDYYIAIDLMTSTYYVCYRTLLMVDIDFYKGQADQQETVIAEIRAYAIEHGISFDLYRSRNGIHAFLISRPADYKADRDIQLMLDLKADFFYVVYSNIRGWSVRLNRKTTEAVMKYAFLGRVGVGQPDAYLLKLVTLHLKLVDVFKNVEPSAMFGN